MKNLALASLIMTTFQFAKAQLSHVTFSQAAFGGTGCKGEETLPILKISKGKASLSISTLGILGNSSLPSLILREACNARLQARVEKGYQLGIRITDVSGSISQTDGVKTTVTAIAGLTMKQDEQTVTQEIPNKIKVKYKVSNKKATDSFSWTECSADDVDTNLAISANIFAVRNQAGSVVNSSIKLVNFAIAVRPCP